MKLALLIELVTLMVTSQCDAKRLHRLALPDPQDWSVGDRLFPAQVIAGYNDDYDKYTNETWAAYIVAKCRRQQACTSAISNSGKTDSKTVGGVRPAAEAHLLVAINSGTPKDRYWFGYTFRGGATTAEDYERVDGVEDSVVYTI
jgi:hypothetical protein